MAVVAAGASWGLAAPAHAAGGLCDPGVVFDGADVLTTGSWPGRRVPPSTTAR